MGDVVLTAVVVVVVVIVSIDEVGVGVVVDISGAVDRLAVAEGAAVPVPTGVVVGSAVAGSPLSPSSEQAPTTSAIADSAATVRRCRAITQATVEASLGHPHVIQVAFPLRQACTARVGLTILRSSSAPGLATRATSQQVSQQVSQRR